MNKLRQLLILGALALACGALRPVDDLDAFIEAQMVQRQIVGLSLAIIDDGRIVETRTYGTTTRGGSVRVTPTTLFQAGSISKPVAAFGALRLVEAGKLALDEDVNAKLKSWRVPDNELTAKERVTLRRLLSHSAGLTVHGFPGYATTERVPSAIEVLDGKGNTPSVVVNVLPGSIWRYSGGGYTVLQQLMVDVTGKSFPQLMQEQVLKPLGMSNSSYEQPPTAAFAARTATGYYADRSEVPGRWHVYPEMAAAGLWTTPTDLAKYAIGVQQALAGKSTVMSAATAREMLTLQKGQYGLGLGLQDSAQTLRFTHGGRDEGFDAQLIAYAHTGDGVAIMINANENSGMVQRVVRYIAKKYDWPNFPQPPAPGKVAPVALPRDALAAVAGRYELRNNFLLTLFDGTDRLYRDIDGLAAEEFVPASADRFVSTTTNGVLTVVRDSSGAVVGLDINGRKIPRVGPLFGKTTATDPDPAVTRNVLAAVEQLAQGVPATSTLFTPGAKKDFTSPVTDVRGVTSARFVALSDVRGRGIERHGHAVARVLHYRIATPKGERLLLVHVDTDGLITDFDLVDR